MQALDQSQPNPQLGDELMLVSDDVARFLEILRISTIQTHDRQVPYAKVFRPTARILFVSKNSQQMVVLKTLQLLIGGS